MQSAPSAAARIVPTGGRGIARDRLRVAAAYGERYRLARDAATRALAEASKPRDGFRDDRVSVVADLAAVYLYLTGEWAWLDEGMSGGTPGPHLPLARCVASGLRRLPLFRGPAIVRTSADEPVAEWYGEKRFVTERSFWGASAPVGGIGGPGFLVWSLTARSTAALDASVPDRVVFMPGTRFKVLRVTDGGQPLVLMRELFPPELAQDDPSGSNGSGTAWLDESTRAELERAVTGPRAATEPYVLASADMVGPRARPPGLRWTKGASDEPVGEALPR
ncbi:hypothetical protein [Streptomyces sp. NPDC020681]|uniref:hypothetical protein n=1 Tax=Streptomyces sp. NPDC020681 TaxID=3365083 RepID=UPI003788FF89